MKHLSDGSKPLEPTEVLPPGHITPEERAKIAYDSDGEFYPMIRNVTPVWSFARFEHRIRQQYYGDEPYRQEAGCAHTRKRFTGGTWYCRDCGQELR
jgi:hypothetical protein